MNCNLNTVGESTNGSSRQSGKTILEPEHNINVYELSTPSQIELANSDIVVT